MLANNWETISHNIYLYMLNTVPYSKYLSDSFSLCVLSTAGSNDVIDLKKQPSRDNTEPRAPHQDPTIQRGASPPPPYSSIPGSVPPCYDTVTRTADNGIGTVTTLAPDDGVFVKTCDITLASCKCCCVTHFFELLWYCHNSLFSLIVVSSQLFV